MICIRTYVCVISGTSVSAPANFTFFPGATTLPIQLTCDVAGGSLWIMNNNTNPVILVLFQLGGTGHDRNGSNILINDNPMNNSEYVCANDQITGQPYHIFVAGM